MGSGALVGLELLLRSIDMSSGNTHTHATRMHAHTRSDAYEYAHTLTYAHTHTRRARQYFTHVARIFVHYRPD